MKGDHYYEIFRKKDYANSRSYDEYKVLEKKLSRKDSQISKLEAENLELHEKLEKYIENEEEFDARQRELEAQIKDFNDIYS